MEEEDSPPKEKEATADEEAEEEQEEGEDGEPVKKKKAPPVIVVKKDKSNRISSDKDCMIELKEWTDSVIQHSAFVLCFSNYRESFVNIASVDIKTRRKTLLKRFNLSNPPTKLF